VCGCVCMGLSVNKCVCGCLHAPVGVYVCVCGRVCLFVRVCVSEGKWVLVCGFGFGCVCDLCV
jgi:hypothetical protein